MSDTAKRAPYRAILAAAADPVAAGSTAAQAAAVAPFAGAVAGVTYVPAADITGAATNNRRLRLVNKGADGTGTTVIATYQFTDGNNADEFAEQALSLSGTAGALDVAEGDVLAWESTHIGTGIADPGGLVRILLDRS